MDLDQTYCNLGCGSSNSDLSTATGDSKKAKAESYSQLQSLMALEPRLSAVMLPLDSSHGFRLLRFCHRRG